MTGSLKDQTIAFAGVLQAGELVRQIATSGQCSQFSAGASIASLFVSEAESTTAVFGGISGVSLGLTMAGELARSASDDSRQAMLYAGGLFRLAALLRRDSERQQNLGRELGLVRPAFNNAESPLDPSVAAQLADIYRSVISSLSMRIQVTGHPTHLKDSEKVSLIRAILLAGVRAAFLWYQLGGRPWRLLFQRGKMFRIAADLAQH
ncbi:MAG: lysogenization regulator HflD [Xanthomonadaceae bacterium]|nr:lysogenization regulator HflD [Xanthomonadaceae bacterium]